jgi:hypothetical protein
MSRLDAAQEQGQPFLFLVPTGSTQSDMRALVQAARLLDRGGEIRRFKLWYPAMEVLTKKLRTCVALPTKEASEFIEQFGVTPTNTRAGIVYPGSVASLMLVAEQEKDGLSWKQARKFLRQGEKQKKSSVWPQLRKLVIRRDGYKCVKCGNDVLDAQLEAHHKVSEADGGGFEPENLETLCQACHVFM